MKSSCLRLVSKLNDGDQDALLSRLDELQAQGVPAAKAQVQAAIDVLMRVQADAVGVRRSATRDVTDTPEFKRWFGDSKVVDAEGKPLVLYHGGAKGITAFDKGKIGASFGYDKDGFFFTTERGQRPGTADNYAGDDGEVYAVYLSLQNPYTLEQFAADLNLEVDDLVIQEGSPQSPITVFDTDREEIMRRVREGGYDGVSFQVDYDDGTNEGMFVALEPEQIKSATGNNGNFDPADPDITRSASRDTYTWRQSIDTSTGPLLEADGFWLIPQREIVQSDFDDGGFGDNGLLGHAERAVPGTRTIAYRIVGDNGIIGTLVSDVDPAGVLRSVHDIEITDRRSGIGSKVVATIAANTQAPIKIQDITDEADPFWTRIGVGYKDQYGDAFLDWEDVAQYLGTRGAAQLDPDAAASEGRGRGLQEGSYEVTELSDEEAAGLFKFSKPRVTELWRKYAEADSGFKFGRDALERSKSIADLAKAFSSPSIRLSEFSVQQPGGSKTLIVNGDPDNGNMTLADVNGDGSKFKIQAADATPYSGRSGDQGSRMYQALLAYAHNNGIVVDADFSLTPVNELRRTSALLSSALRFDSTKHIGELSDQQGVTGWTGESFADDVAALAEAELRMVEKKIPAAKQLEIDKNGTVRTNSEEVLAAIRDAGDRRESVDSRSALVESRRVGSEDTQGASNRQAGPGAGDARLRDGGLQDDVYDSPGAPTSLAERLAELGGARIEDQELVDYLASTGGGFGAHGVGINTLKRALVTKAAIQNGVIETSQQGLLFSLPRPAFYSQLQRSIEQVPDRLATMAAPQWKLWLDANASKLGIKKDEIEWSGITDYLELRGKDKVSRDDLVAYLADSGVRVQEVVLGNQTDRQKLSDEYGRAVAASDAAGGAMNPVYIENLAPGDRRPEEQALLDAWNRVNENPDESWLPDAGNPKYGKYTVPGGENYREVLITLPDGRTPAPERAARPRVVDRGHDDRGRAQFEVVQDGEVVDIFSNWAEAQDRALEIEEEENIRRNLEWRKSQPVTYKSDHWDQPNILAHLRVDDRTDADGNKVLFIGELQSDWGQQAKKDGIRSSYKAEDVKPIQAGDPAAAQPDVFWYFQVPGNVLQIPKSKHATEAAAREYIIREKPVNPSGVPAAPFISDTKSWASLALKRAIMMAVEEGHDRIAFITGQQAADLYDLSKQISRVEFSDASSGGIGDANLGAPDGSGNLSAFDLDGKRVIDTYVSADKIEDYVGKEVARKLLESEPKGVRAAGVGMRRRSLDGLDLKVGGEGMRVFYDEIIHQVARDVLKKLGGGQIVNIPMGGKYRIEVTRTGQRSSYDVVDNERRIDEAVFSAPTEKEAQEWIDARAEDVSQPGFDITPAMREKVASGVPLFSKSRNPQVDTPEFRRWFGDSKVVDAQGKPRVVYHGTRADFSTFDPDMIGDNYGLDREGFFFTNNTIEASGYADPASQFVAAGMSDPTYREAKQGANVMPVYLNLQNPLTLERYTGDHYTTPEIEIDEQGINLIDYFDDNRLSIMAFANERGHDGVLFERNGRTLAVAFRPEQIKSATGNNGQFDPANPDITKSLPRIPGLNAGPVERTTGDYGREYTPQQLRMFKNVGRTTSKPALIDRLKEARKDLGKKMAQGIVDQFRPIRELGGNAYTLARLSKGSAGAFEALLGHGKLKIVDGAYDADTTGGFLDRVGKPLGKELEDFMFWVASNRAESLSIQGRENLFTQEDIDAGKSLADGDLEFDYLLPNGAVTRDRRAAYEDSLAKFNEFNKNVLDIAEESGLIDGESRQFWEGEFYVPFYRVSEEDGEFVGAKIKGGLARQRAFHELKGGSQKLNSDLLANTMRNWAHLIDASAKNRAAKATLEAAQAVGIALESDAETVRQLGKSMGGKGGTVWFMDGGQQRHFLIGDPYLLEAINSLEYAGLRGPLMDALSTMKHWLTVGVTASPAFKVRNLIRDSIQAISLSGLSYNPVKNLVEGYKATDRASQDYVSALASGGLIRFGTMLEGNAAERVRRLVQKGVPASTILNTPGKVKDFYGKFVEPAVEAYQELGNRGEEINRASLYKQLRAQGVNHAEASLMARDLMDFSMQGTWTSIRFLTQVVPFLNARLQGLYKLGRGAAEDPKRFAMVAGATALVSIALLGAYGDDDDWKKREDWDRDGFWWFKFGGTAFRIPKPFEVGAIATLAERGVELFTNDEFTAKRFGSRVMRLLGDNLAMNPIPQAVKPMLDIYANKDSFSGRPIESMGMERLQSEYRYNVNTSMIARGASSALNAVTRTVGVDSLSPVQIDSLIRGYFGWLGTFVVAGADMAVRPLTSEPARPQPDYLKVVTQGFLRTLPEPGSKYVSAMYDQAKILEQAFATHRQMLKEGKLDEAREFAAENKDLLDRYRLIEAVKKTQSNVNRRIREIEISDMDPARKRDEIQKLRDQADRSARVVY